MRVSCESFRVSVVVRLQCAGPDESHRPEVLGLILQLAGEPARLWWLLFSFDAVYRWFIIPLNETDNGWSRGRGISQYRKVDHGNKYQHHPAAPGVPCPA